LAIERLRGATLNELGSLLSHATRGRGRAGHIDGSPLEAFAQAVLDAPASGSKLRFAEGAIVAHALDACGGNISAAARLLGVDRKALERRARRLGRARKRA